MGPLDGVRVVELAGMGPAPFAAMMLSDMGADIIRVDRLNPGEGGMNPKLLSGAERMPINRGRRSISADLRKSRGRDVFLALVETADVLLEGFRPGVAERLGIGPDICHARNPRLVYGRMTGWGQSGPLARSAGHDITYIAITGALASIAREGERPLAPLSLVGDYGGGGMLLAFGVLCGLLESRNSGTGQVVDASIVDGVATQMVGVLGRVAQGVWRNVPGTNHNDSGSHWYEVYETRDGKYLAVGAMEEKFYSAFIRGLGLTTDEIPQWDRERWPELKQRVAEVIRTRTRKEWCDLYEGTDACVAPVLGIGEALDYVPNVAREVFTQRDGVVQPSPAPRFSRTPGTIAGPPPAKGADSDEILHELGYTEALIASLRSDGTIG